MTVVSQEIQDDLALAKEVLSKKDVSIVLISCGKIWKEKKGNGIKPILELVEEMGNELSEYIIGDRILGRASAFLCRYANVKAVYSPQATKTAIAILILGGVPCQIDQMIPHIKNRDGTGMCPFEKMLENIVEPEVAYNVLKENMRKK